MSTKTCIYVFDNGPLIDLFRNFYEKQFPSLWKKFDELVESGELVSVSEVLNEISKSGDRLDLWSKKNKDLFKRPTVNELEFVAEIFKVEHFQQMVRKQERLQGKPVADPFVIARAHEIKGGCVVTSEIRKQGSASVRIVCDHFKIRSLNLEEFMEENGWIF